MMHAWEHYILWVYIPNVVIIFTLSLQNWIACMHREIYTRHWVSYIDFPKQCMQSSSSSYQTRDAQPPTLPVIDLQILAADEPVCG